MNAPQYGYCLGCGRGFSGPPARLAPAIPMVAAEAGPPAVHPVAAGPPFSEQPHPWLRRLAWAVWALTVLTLPALGVALWQAVEFDQRHDYDQGAALQVALLAVLYVVTSAGVVLLTTALATNDFRSRTVQVLAGAAFWFLALQFIVIWVITLVASRIKPAKSTDTVRRLFGHLAGGSAATLVGFVAGIPVGFMPPVGLGWLVVMVWAPIRLVKEARSQKAARPS